MYTAVFIDSLSIQQYIFSSNKLSEQIGASYIVEKLLFDECIPEAIEIMFGYRPTKDELEEWNRKPEYYKLDKEPNLEFEIGYIGGGNALLIFRDHKVAKNFITTYSKLLLQYLPGIKTAFAQGEFLYSGTEYQKCRTALNEQLIQNRNFYPAISYPFKPGIVDDCNSSGEAKEKLDENEKEWFSTISTCKRKYIDKATEALTKDLLENAQKVKYALTNNQDMLGQEKDKGYLAIVHADGNGMGKKFLEAESLAQTRKLSSGTQEYAQKVMRCLIKDVINVIESDVEYHWKLFNLKKNKKDGKTILPVRPIICGGDDITLVCEGRLGLYLGERLLRYMSTTPIDGKNIQACAGVVLVHSKFPFYKAYKLCEEVTKEAKKESRDANQSLLHYHVSTGGFSGGYDDIVQQEFTVKDKNKGCLKNGPYLLYGKSGQGKSLLELKEGLIDFAENWPRNKAKQLRDILRKPEAEEQFFLASIQLNAEAKSMQKTLGITLETKEKEKITLWQNNTTPFFDRIELLDFYPLELLKLSIEK